MLGLPLGNLAARGGRRVALTTGWWTATIGATLLLVSAQWNLVIPLFVGLLLIGAGSAASLQSRFAAADLAEPQNMARSLALVAWAGTLGSALGPNLGIPGEIVGNAIGLTTFAGAFLITSICLALAGLVIFVWLRPDPLLLLLGRTPQEEVTVPKGKQSGRIRRVVTALRTTRSACTATVAILTAQAVMVAIMTMPPVHIAHQGGLITIIGITISLHIAGMYAFAPLVRVIVNLSSHRLTISAGIAIFFTSLSIGAVQNDDAVWLIVALILLGIGWSFVNVAVSTF